MKLKLNKLYRQGVEILPRLYIDTGKKTNNICLLFSWFIWTIILTITFNYKIKKNR
jgi:hypothetical protein